MNKNKNSSVGSPVKAVRGLTAKSINIAVKSLTQKVHWFLIGDAHLGNTSHDCVAFENLRKNILKIAQDNLVLISFMGDMIESIVPGDKRHSPAEQKDYTESVNDFYAWLKPLLSNKNIVFNGFLIGNHELTLAKKGINAAEEIEDRTEGKVEQYGSVVHNIIHIKCKGRERTLRAVLAHQAGSTKSQAALEAYARESYDRQNEKGEAVRCRITAAGHTHDLRYTPCLKTIYQDEGPGMGPMHDTIHVCRTGSFMKQDYGFTNYTTEAGLIGKTAGYIEIEFSMEMLPGEGDRIKVYTRCNGDLNKNSSVNRRGEV